MKIHQLPMNARFEYEGQEYVKTGPLLATGPGGQRLIPKYAVLKMIGEALQLPPKRSGELTKAAVRESFDIFYRQCTALVKEDRQAELLAARERFLNELDKASTAPG